MSDLNDLIARNAIMSFNEGLETGARQERERIIKLLKDKLNYAEWEGLGWKYEPEGKTGRIDVDDLIELIKGEQK